LAEIGVEMKFGQKTACLDMATFLPNLGKKSQFLRFGRYLVFGGGLKHSNIW
jgi:hypothetical protein